MRGISTVSTSKHDSELPCVTKLASISKYGVDFSKLRILNSLRLSNKRRRLRLSALNNNFSKSREEMAMQFDHMYIECLESKSSLSKELETKHLKELVLLHLDLIQQQAEDLAAKDKIIKELTKENEQLRDHLQHTNKEKSSQEEPSKPVLAARSTNEDGPCKANTCSRSNSSINNNNTVISDEIHSATCDDHEILAAEVATKAPSPVLSRPAHHKSASHSPLAAYCSKSRTVSPNSRTLRNNTLLPIQKTSVKTEINVSTTSCEPIISLRHSPRLDSLNAASTDDSSSSVSQNTNLIKNESPHESSVENSTLHHNRRNSKLSLSRRQSLIKKTQASDRKSKSEVSCSEADSSEGEGWSEGLDAARGSHVATGLVVSRQHPSASNSVAGKRKSDGCEADQSKKQKRMPDDIIVQDYLSLNSLAEHVDQEGDLPDGTTTHSLRSRGPARDSSASPGLQSDLPTKVNSEELQKDNKRQLRRRSTSSSSSDDVCGSTSSTAPVDGGVSSQEYEKVFVKAACEAAAKLKEQNVIVPPCSLRAVRSKEGYLSTEEPYFLPTDPPADLYEPGDTSLPLAANAPPQERSVEIPSWRVSVLTPLYVMEGTENLEDEIFTKRHHKLEQDEKRRKRWDLQRLREQRQYEKLRERYEVRNSSVPSSSSSTSSADIDSTSCTSLHCHLHSGASASASGACNGSKLSGGAAGGGGNGSGGGVGGGGAGGGATELWSLWPDPSNALFLEVVDKVPVCALGQPCALLPPVEFSLPWLSSAHSDTGLRRKRR